MFTDSRLRERDRKRLTVCEEREREGGRRRRALRRARDLPSSLSPCSPSPDNRLACKALNKMELDYHRETMAAFIQCQSCSEAAPKQVKCRECRLNAKAEGVVGRSGGGKPQVGGSPSSPSSRSSAASPNNNIFCRFYAFRRLRFNRKGVLTTSGFSDSHDAQPDDMALWLPHFPRKLPDVCKTFLCHLEIMLLSLFNLCIRFFRKRHNCVLCFE